MNYYKPLWDELTKLDHVELVMFVSYLLAQLDAQNPLTLQAVVELINDLRPGYKDLLDESVKQGAIAASELLEDNNLIFIHPTLPEPVTSRPSRLEMLEPENTQTL